MPPTDRVLLLSMEVATRQATAAVLAPIPADCIFCRDLEELATALERESVPLALIDIDSQPAALLEALEPLINRHVHSRFVVLTAHPCSELIMRAMQIGVRHVQDKAAIGAQLGVVAQRLLNGYAAERPARGALVALLSAGGGCGATLLAINLADRLRAGGDSVLLVDGDPYYGAVGAYLGLEGSYGLADILEREAALDEALVRSTAVHVENGMEVLLAPARQTALDTGNLDAFLEVCRQAYGCTVLDLPRLPLEAARQVARTASLTLVVMQLSVKDVRVARALSTALAGEGRLMLVINRYERRHAPVELSEIKPAFAGLPLVCLRNDYRNASRAVIEGQPLVRCAPRSGLARDVEELARQVLARARPGNGSNGRAAVSRGLAAGLDYDYAPEHEK